MTQISTEIYTADEGWVDRAKTLTLPEDRLLRATAAKIAAARRPAEYRLLDAIYLLRLPHAEFSALAELLELTPRELRDRAEGCQAGTFLRVYVPAERPTREDMITAANQLFGRRAGFPAHGDRLVTSVC